MINSLLYVHDIENVIKLKLPWEKLENKNILVTGATGMIGSCIVDVLMNLGDVNVFALGRNFERGKLIFSKYFGEDRFKFIAKDVTNKLDINIRFDYIIHAASGATPDAYKNYPVETMTANFLGLYNLMEYAREYGLERFVYISSGEVYGETSGNVDSFKEDYSGYVDITSVRSCYPSAKRASETLLVSYGSEYNIDGVIVRPAHIYGPTMTDKDDRAVSTFIRNAVNGKDIVLNSSGSQVRSYCYVFDAVSAIFYTLFYGNSGEAYNISDLEGKVSVKELAELVARISGVGVDFSNCENDGRHFAVLNDSKLKDLGWRRKYSIYDGITRTIDILKGEKLYD